MTDEPPRGELSSDGAFRSIGRYVYEFSQLILHMRSMMTRHLNTTPQAVAELAFAESPPEQIATAFFGMCRTVTRLDLDEEKTGARLHGRVSEAIEMRSNVAHGDWWVGSSVLGAGAIELSARDLDARSGALIDLTNLVSEYGAVCLHEAPYAVGEHRLSDYLVMRAGEVVREGPKAVNSPRVFYSTAALTQAPDSFELPGTLGLEHPPPQPAPEAEPFPAPPIAAVPPPPPPAPVAAPPEQTIAAASEVVPAGAAIPPAGGQRPGFSHRLRFVHGRVSQIRSTLGERAASTKSSAGATAERLGDRHYRRLRQAMLAIAAVTAALLGIVAYSGQTFGTLELKTIDARFSLRGTQSPPSNIVIVAIDENAVNTLGGFPFHRRYHADVINALHAAGAKAIGYDVQFTTPTDATDDNDLYNAVAKARGIVLSTDAVLAGGGTTVLGGGAALRETGAKPANSYIEPDSDGVLRRTAYSFQKLKTFAVVLAQQALGHPVPAAEFPGGTALIDFVGPPQTFKQIPFLEVLHHKFPAGSFRGKIVLVGTTDPVLQDVHATAVGDGLMSGVEFQANAVWSILRRSPLRQASGAINVVLILLLSLLMPLAGLRLRPGMLMVGIAIAIGVVYVIVAQIAFNAGTVLSFVYPLFGLTLGTVEATAADLWAERRHRRHLEVAFEALPSAASAAFFVSYRRDQSSWPARILRDELVRRFGEAQVFMDADSIDAGQQWPDRLEKAISGASVVLVLIGPGWVDAKGSDGSRRLDNPEDWVRLEVEAALRQESVAVVPVLLDDAAMPAAEILPDSLKPLSARHALSLSPERWSSDLDTLMESIQSGRMRDYLAKQGSADS
jgi:CHASE2 domain-containing sensor protein